MGRTSTGWTALVLLLSAAGCGGLSEPGPRTEVVTELGFSFPAPAGARDVLHVAGEGPEGAPAAYLSTASLARTGGPTCAAGATGAVSPYPLGRVLVAELLPDQAEVRSLLDPEESPGEPLVQLGSRWLYWLAPPGEPCTRDADAARLQEPQMALVKQALRSATPLAGGARPSAG